MSVRRWLAGRTGADEVWNKLFARPIPEAAGASAWLYTLGSASLTVFLIQAISGALLAMNYVPSPDHAYDSVRYIESQVFMGSLMRGLHHWGASFMVVLAGLHMLRVYFMGSYKYPREATWLAGVGLFLLILVMSFTGYLLPWDQKAYWATVVGTNIAGQVPYLGSAIANILRGGGDMGPATLTRFYALHVVILPSLVVLFIAAHLFLVIWHGISEPPRKGEPSEGAGSHV